MIQNYNVLPMAYKIHLFSYPLIFTSALLSELLKASIYNNTIDIIYYLWFFGGFKILSITLLKVFDGVFRPENIFLYAFKLGTANLIVIFVKK